MFSLRTISLFFVKCLLIYVALITIPPLMGFDDYYRSRYRKIGNSFFGKFSEEKRVTFLVEYRGTYDTQINASDLTLKQGWNSSINAWFVGYLPIALLLSLILASPITWKRRLWGILFGLILINLFTLLMMWVKINQMFLEINNFLKIESNEFWKGFISKANDLVVLNVEVHFIIPIFIWLLVSFNIEDWRRLTQQAKP